jgi:hypothetical protein
MSLSAGEVHDEVPGHRLELAKGLVDENALDVVDDAGHAVRQVADERAQATAAIRPEARHRAGQPLGPVAWAKGLAVALVRVLRCNIAAARRNAGL